MAKEQVLRFKPARRLEEVDGEYCERMQKREHRPRSCGDSTRPCDSQGGWDFRKGQDAGPHERAAAHSITSSASCWRCKGTLRPNALAVLRLTAPAQACCLGGSPSK